MTEKKVRVAVNGYGVIGKRVTDAVRVQPDMELVGVADIVSDYRVKAAVLPGLPVYASLPDRVVDAIRALAGMEREGHTSIRITDEALGIQRDFLTG